MRAHLLASASPWLLLVLSLARNAYGTEYWVGPPGVANGTGTQGAPFARIGNAAARVTAGDTVHIHGGVYAESIRPASGGTSSAWVTFEAVPGELPILDSSPGVGTGMSAAGTSGFIRFIGIASRRWNSSGFDNGFNNSAGNVQFINCIADNNGINGIAFYKATGVLIQNSIIAHNGNQMPSWSSGVNIFTVGGTFQDNRIVGNVSFENVDITTTHSNPAGGPTDGSGFILDQNSTGALFENNIGFHNGGSCIRLTNSPAAHLINNTCYHDAADPGDLSPSNPAEIFFSQPSTTTNVVVTNNLLVPASNNTAINATSGTGSTFAKNLSVATAFVNPTAVDFELMSTATAVVDQGDVATAPSTDIGFDPKCITQDASKAAPVVGQAVSWWTYYIDYSYIASVGGIAGCFHPAVRPQGNGPDVGAYEYGGVLADAGAGGSSSSSSSGGGSSGGSSGGSTSSSGGRSSSSGGSSGAPDGGAAGSNSGSGGGSSGASGSASSGSGGGTGGASSGGSGGGSPGASNGAAGSSGSSGSGASSGGSNPGTPDFGATSNAKGCACGVITSAQDSPGLLLAGLGILAARARRRGRGK